MRGNESFEYSRTPMGCSVGGRLVGCLLGDAEPNVANEKAAMQRSSTGLNLFTAIAQDGIWTLLE